MYPASTDPLPCAPEEELTSLEPEFPHQQSAICSLLECLHAQGLYWVLGYKNRPTHSPE